MYKEIKCLRIPNPQPKLQDFTVQNRLGLLLISLKHNPGQFIFPKTKHMVSLFLYSICFGSKARIHIFRHDKLFYS